MMELESSFSSTSSLRGEYLKQCCKLGYQRKWLKNKAIFLILTWSFLSMSLIVYYNTSTKRDTLNPNVERPQSSELIVMCILLLFGGWLADAYFGRYPIIYCGIWIMWIGSVLSVFSLIICKLYPAYTKGDRYVSLFSKLVMGLGFGLFQSNIVQFGVDQLRDASSTEITSFITCYTLTFFVGCGTLYYGTTCTPDYVGVLILTVSLSLALCSLFLFNHLLVKEHVIQNPLPLIWKVTHYAIRNNRLQQIFPSMKSGGCLSRLDVAKTIYSGPFLSEQVEEVKTFFRAVVVIAACSLALTGISSINTIQDRMLQHGSNTSRNCYETVSIQHSGFIFNVLLVLLYLIVIQPIFNNCIPKFSIMSKFIIAPILHFIGIIASLGIVSASYHYQLAAHPSTVDHCYLLPQSQLVINFYTYWIVIPKVFGSLSLFFLLVAGLEFVCAQVPCNMKGLVIGISYANFGLGTLIQTVLSLPFLHFVKETVWGKAPFTCEIWYFIIQAFIVLVGFLVTLMAIRKYKQRTRIDVKPNDWRMSDD